MKGKGWVGIFYFRRKVCRLDNQQRPCHLNDVSPRTGARVFEGCNGRFKKETTDDCDRWVSRLHFFHGGDECEPQHLTPQRPGLDIVLPTRESGGEIHHHSRIFFLVTILFDVGDSPPSRANLVLLFLLLHRRRRFRRIRPHFL